MQYERDAQDYAQFTADYYHAINRNMGNMFEYHEHSFLMNRRLVSEIYTGIFAEAEYWLETLTEQERYEWLNY